MTNEREAKTFLNCFVMFSYLYIGLKLIKNASDDVKNDQNFEKKILEMYELSIQNKFQKDYDFIEDLLSEIKRDFPDESFIDDEIDNLDDEIEIEDVD